MKFSNPLNATTTTVVSTPELTLLETVEVTIPAGGEYNSAPIPLPANCRTATLYIEPIVGVEEWQLYGTTSNFGAYGRVGAGSSSFQPARVFPAVDSDLMVTLYGAAGSTVTITVIGNTDVIAVAVDPPPLNAAGAAAPAALAAGATYTAYTSPFTVNPLYVVAYRFSMVTLAGAPAGAYEAYLSVGGVVVANEQLNGPGDRVTTAGFVPLPAPGLSVSAGGVVTITASGANPGPLTVVAGVLWKSTQAAY